MSKVDLEKVKIRFKQAKQYFIQIISSLEDNEKYYELKLWKELIESNYLGLEEDYKLKKVNFVANIYRLNPSTHIIKELVWVFSIFISVQWQDALTVTPPNNQRFTKQQKQSIKAAYVVNDINTNLKEYELTQEELDKVLHQFKTRLLSFIEKNLHELNIDDGTLFTQSVGIRSVGRVNPWDNNEFISSSKPSQKNTDKKWWQFWKQ
jgi:hypothetical protein